MVYQWQHHDDRDPATDTPTHFKFVPGKPDVSSVKSVKVYMIMSYLVEWPFFVIQTCFFQQSFTVDCSHAGEW